MMRSRQSRAGSAIALGGFTLILPAWLAAQTCTLQVAGLNQNRKIFSRLIYGGYITAECPGDLHYCPPWVWPEHSVPFGNWGVTSNFGQKQNAHQFQGWCRYSWVCDNYGNCGTHCTDNWREWNSCTSWTQWGAPNCTLYNCYGQVTWLWGDSGNNVHGTIGVNLAVSCPYDTNGDGYCDTGGCRDVFGYGTGTNWMTLYELDGCDEDELVQSLYFPQVSVYLNCSPGWCNAAGSSWAAPIYYDTPSWPPLVDARMAMVVNFGV